MPAHAAQRALPMRSDHAAMAGLTLLALLLRAWGLDSDLWLDEVMTLEYMRTPPLESASTFHAANQHLLNSVLGSISIRILGEQAWSVRLPAMLFGVATVPVFFALARRVTSRREALFASLLLTLSYHHVWFSQNARGYAGMIFFTTLSTLLLLRGLERRRWSDWSWFGACGGLGMLCLLNYAFVLAGQFLGAAIDAVGRRQWRALCGLAGSGVLAVVVTLLGYAAILPAMVDYFTGGHAELGWRDPLGLAREFAGGLTAALPALALPALLGAGLIAGVGWHSYLGQRRIVAFMRVLPAAFNGLALAVLEFGAYPRSFLYVLPFGILVAVRGAFVLGETARRALPSLRDARWVVYVLPVLILAGALVMLPYNYLHPKQDYSGALAYARSESRPGDVIAAVGHLAAGYRSYHARDLAFPASAEELAALAEPGRRVWVLYSFTRDMRRQFPDIRDHLEQHFERRRVFPGTLGDGDVYVVVSEDPEPARASRSAD